MIIKGWIVAESLQLLELRSIQPPIKFNALKRERERARQACVSGPSHKSNKSILHREKCQSRSLFSLEHQKGISPCLNLAQNMLYEQYWIILSGNGRRRSTVYTKTRTQ
eukprot:TRINITY_DN9093_c0_g1_i1.p3 TRINITY_DN9093_c0_g1~~TRINITY_DN9093_c0_g1_i1.p3  ORF type:complete len:109 (-),score=5.04 TRINITY_DN9093_c0_g1_i1:197-523(-)